MEIEAKLISNGKGGTQVEHHGVEQLGKIKRAGKKQLQCETATAVM